MASGLAAVPGRACRCSPDPAELPVGLLEIAVQDLSLDPSLVTVDVGYENQTWRAEALADHIMEWVLDFALRPSERKPLEPGRAMETMRRAVNATFGNGNDRGLPGEILLHALCRQFYGSDTVISKVWFKTADNDTYKGFDGVHCVHSPDDELELWLGEAKFYKGVGKAIAAVLADLDDHLSADYLHNEFAIISDKVDDSHPHAAELRRMMHKNTSLDVVFSRIVVPVFVTYNSSAAELHDRICPEYTDALETEARRAWMKFKAGLDVSSPVTVKLFLLPMASKQALLDAIEQRLLGWR